MKPGSPSKPEEQPVDAEAATVLHAGSGARLREEPDDEIAPPTVRFARASSEASASHPPAVDVRPRPVEDQPFVERYRLERVLGQGGMGEVWRCADDRIGREVAMKVIHPGHGVRSDLRARFEREARIQGQLEHPSVVPVYDLGVRPDGAAYFTMKRIVGRTLEEILDGLRAVDPEIQAGYSRRKLLSAFSNACLAVAFAHQRDVIHRDLKPANIILGPFGEVYVLDWGVAKVVQPTGEEPAPPLPDVTRDDATGRSDEVLVAAESSPSSASDADTLVPSKSSAVGVSGSSEATITGTLLGTPGYMSPEQAAGDVDAIDNRSDVYSLGAILFELLTLQQLHQGQTAEQLIARTLAGADARARERGATGVAPELEAICVRATALAPADRFATVQELHDAVERYLDGDRDLERRREMSRQHEQNAEQALADAGTDAGLQVQARATALRELNQALALDPSNESALAAMVGMLMHSTGTLAPDAEAEFQRARHRDHARAARAAAIAFLALFLLDPLMTWMGIRSDVFMWIAVPFVFGTAMALYWASKSSRLEPWHFYCIATLSAGIAGWTALIFGPYFIAPGAMVALAAPIAIVLRANRPQRIYLMVTGSLAVLLPAGLQYVGWLPPSYEFRDGIMAILPLTVDFPAIPAQLFLLGTALVVILAPLYVIGASIDRSVRAERHLFAQAWNLRELMPAAARDEAGAKLVQPPEPSDRCPL